MKRHSTDKHEINTVRVVQMEGVLMPRTGDRVGKAKSKREIPPGTRMTYCAGGLL